LIWLDTKRFTEVAGGLKKIVENSADFYRAGITRVTVSPFLRQSMGINPTARELPVVLPMQGSGVKTGRTTVVSEMAYLHPGQKSFAR
jgi:hypothetical protein